MKALISTLIVLMLATSTLQAQRKKRRKADTIPAKVEQVQQVPAIQGPEIQFEKVVHDYGTIAPGANGDCEFKFKNIGNEPLILAGVQASCGCTVPTYSREPIMPGGEGVIKVHYDTNRIGQINKALLVSCNAKSDRISLRIVGNVDPSAPANPANTATSK